MNQDNLTPNQSTDTVFLATGKVRFTLNNKGQYVITIIADDLSKDLVGDLAELCALPSGVAITLSARDFTRELAELQKEGYDTDLV